MDKTSLTHALRSTCRRAWRQATRPDVVEGIKRGLMIGVAAAVVVLPATRLATARWDAPTSAAQPAPATTLAANPAAPRWADFGATEAPPDVRHIADWAADSRDPRGMDFIVLDKRRAHVYVFDREAKLVADTPVLLGAAVGDDTAEGVGKKALHEVLPEERTTPAGRFIGESGRNAHGEDVFWVDYDAAVSMHRVRELEPSERRHERLASATADDNRISYGCINMPVEFFDQVMVPHFKGRRAVVYVLPESRALADVFPTSYDVAQRHGGALPTKDLTTARND